jgi:hypothetical protein
VGGDKRNQRVHDLDAHEACDIAELVAAQTYVRSARHLPRREPSYRPCRHCAAVAEER